MRQRAPWRGYRMRADSQRSRRRARPEGDQNYYAELRRRVATTTSKLFKNGAKPRLRHRPPPSPPFHPPPSSTPKGER